MPVIDGYEAVRQLRARGCSAPIIAVTAYAMREDRDECLAIGCDDHISKPIEWDRLFLSLSELLAGARAEARRRRRSSREVRSWGGEKSGMTESSLSS